MKVFVTVAAFLGTTYAACPNACSGHGTCDSESHCTCFSEAASNRWGVDWDGDGLLPTGGSYPSRGYPDGSLVQDASPTARYGANIVPAWEGADCSRRTCPRGVSWTKRGSSSDPNAEACSHLEEQECSDQGKCDYATGTCSCFPGYDGHACQRTSCPNDCSGHGSCRSNKDFAYDFGVAKTQQLQAMSPDTTSDVLDADGNEPLVKTIPTEQFQSVYKATYNSAWDSGKHYGCLCDAGYRGTSCDMVECPSFHDPLDDKCDDGTDYSTCVTDNDGIITCQGTYRNQVTGLVEEEDETARDLAIRNFQLQFPVATGAAGWNSAYKAVGANGDQNEQFLDDPSGTGKIYACFGKMAGQECSGRGVCDYSIGACQCFEGYSGTSCQAVESLA